MKRLLYPFVVAMIVWQTSANSGEAQLVQVGPGFVKAPFVRVYTDPDGGSYVRAPFVEIYTPGDDMSDIREFQPAAEFGAMSWQSLRQAALDWTNRLDSDLASFPSGEFWKANLKTREIARLIPTSGDAPPSAEVREQLLAIVQIFDSVGSSPDVNRVASLTSFWKLRAVLSEYATVPDLRLRRQLSATAQDLNRALLHFTTASNWQAYLMLNPGMALAEAQLLGNGPVQNRDGLAEALQHFEAADQNEQYAQITSLAAFKPTKDLLTAYLHQPPAAPSTPETLPAPPKPRL